MAVAVITTLLGNQGDPVEYTVDATVAVPKGTLMRISSSPQTALAATTDGQFFAGVAAVAISISLIFSAMKEDDAAKALGKILAGGLAAGIAALLFGVAAPVVIAIGALAVLIGIVIKFNFDPKWRNAVDNFFRGIKERIENWINVIKGFGLFKGIKILRQKEPDAIFRLDQGVAGVSEFELGPRSGRGEAGRIARGEQNIIVNNTNNINVSNSEEMERLLRENNLTLVEEVKKQVGV